MTELKKNGTTFEVKGLTAHKVIIGGKDKFIPNINHSFSFEKDDEFFLNLNRKAVTVGNEKSAENSGRVSLKVGKETQEYYIQDGRLKWDIVLDDQPDSPDIEFEIKCSDGVEFWYQPFLEDEFRDNPRGCKTLGEFREMAGRPEDVEGSYAVYCTKRNNKYMVGKLLHIYRPLIITADGRREYGFLSIDNGKLIVTIPESLYKDSAAYPLTIDPDLGYTTAGASVYTSSPIWACMNALCQAGSDGTMTAIKTYVTCVSTADIGLAWYTRGGDSLPETRNDYTTVGVTASSWQTGTATSAVVSGTYYHPAVCKPGTSIGLHYDASSGARSWYNGTNAMPASDPIASSDTWNYSVYLSYTEGGGTSIIPLLDSTYRRHRT